ncbi:MAG TPA: TRIC cation channel family protein [Candidatus Nanopelagicales bacterium]|jgi:uncharacterized membrane protein YeiH|nr:TRIC cation channel family protein [Candidatus Nanopelagicales bacterium]
MSAADGVAHVITLPAWIELSAVTFGALSGALHATRMKLDPVGVFTIALISAVGGGVIRDVLLQDGIPVFLVTSTYLELAALAAAVGFFFAGAVRAARPVMEVVDTLLIGAWVLIGAERALVLGLPGSTAVLIGVITASFGGIVRDVLCRQVPPTIVQPGEWYAAAAILAAISFVVLVAAGVDQHVAEISTLVIAAGARWLSLARGWRTPTAFGLWSDLADRLEQARLRDLAHRRDWRG